LDPFEPRESEEAQQAVDAARAALSGATPRHVGPRGKVGEGRDAIDYI